ncbi:MAG TPA: hypothetical protein GX700_02675 [Paracoccus sp.]|nr:hypothetical protein [Paracoccus sp. (in: a-proteobacteria)]
MLEDTTDTVLRRKLAPKVDTPVFDFSAPSLDQEPAGGKLLPRAFIRAASRVAGIVARASVRSGRGVALAELVDLPEGEGFAALLNAREGPPGLVVFDPSAFSSVMEAMTIGVLSNRPPATRRATLTDAALMVKLVDAIMSEVDANPDPADPFAPGFRQGRLIDDLRLLDVKLEDVPFALTVLDVELLAEGTLRRGVVSIALPAPVPEVAAFPDFARPFDDGPAQDLQWESALVASVMPAPARMEAVLGRVRMPLAEVLALEVGSQMTLPLSQLEEVQLEGLDGSVLALGRLGQYRGMRALCLTTLRDPEGFDEGPAGQAAVSPADPAPEPEDPPGAPSLLAWEASDAGGE